MKKKSPKTIAGRKGNPFAPFKKKEMRTLARLNITARYAESQRTYEMPEGTTVNELWLRAVVGDDEVGPIGIPEDVDPYLRDVRGNIGRKPLPWDIKLMSGVTVVFVAVVYDD